MELIQQREMKLNQALRAAQRQQSLESNNIQRLTIRNRDVRTADDNDYKGITSYNEQAVWEAATICPRPLQVDL